MAAGHENNVKPRYATYSKALVKKFCDLLGSGKYTIADCCVQCGMSLQTFYNWKQNKVEFLDAIELAEERRMDSIKEMAVSGLAKLVDVYEYDEVKQEFVYEKDAQGQRKRVPLKTVATKKKVMPNQSAIAFALTNADAKRWKSRQNVDHTNNGDSFSFGNFLMDIGSIPVKEEESEVSEEIVTDEMEIPEDQSTISDDNSNGMPWGATIES